MTAQEIDFIEKVKLPEYEGYGWGNTVKIIRDLIAEVRGLWDEKTPPEVQRIYTDTVSG